jgi:hypothetical protein
MREIIKDFVRALQPVVPMPGPVVEFGSLQVQGQEGFADLRPLFPGRAYVGCDLRGGRGVDCLMDVCAPAWPSHWAGTVLCLETLEHVADPLRAGWELAQLTRADGVCLVSTHMNFVIHAFPDDYWRFTPSGLRLVLREFTNVYVGWSGEELNPHSVVAVGAHLALDGRVVTALGSWRTAWAMQPPGRDAR